MIPENLRKTLEKQHYKIVGEHSAIQVCSWTKKAIRGEEGCYKQKFYGIKSHLCCQMTPAVMWCQNKCVHCWRAIELNLGDKINGKINSPKEIIDGCIKAQREMLIGFKKLPKTEKESPSRANMKNWTEAQEPMQFAISLSGEPMIYENIGGIIEELRKRGKTSFLVTNGLYPEKLEEIDFKKHSGVITHFQQTYIKKNVFDKEFSNILAEAFAVRNKCDYNDYFIVSTEDALNQKINAKKFIDEVEKYLETKVYVKSD